MKMNIKPVVVTENLNLYVEKICGNVAVGTAVLTKGNEKVIKFFTLKLYPTKKFISPIEYSPDPLSLKESSCSYSISKEDFNTILSAIKERASRFLTTTFDTFNLNKDDIEKLHPTFKPYKNLIRVYLSDEQYDLWNKDYRARQVPRTFRMEILYKDELLFWVPKVETVSIPPAVELENGKIHYKLVSNRFFVSVVEGGEGIELGVYWRWGSDFQVKLYKNGQKVVFHSNTVRKNDLFPVSDYLINLEVIEKNGKKLLTLDRKKLPKHIKSILDSIVPSIKLDKDRYIFIPDEWTEKHFGFTKEF